MIGVHNYSLRSEPLAVLYCIQKRRVKYVRAGHDKHFDGLRISRMRLKRDDRARILEQLLFLGAPDGGIWAQMRIGHHSTTRGKLSAQHVRGVGT